MATKAKNKMGSKRKHAELPDGYSKFPLTEEAFEQQWKDPLSLLGKDRTNLIKLIVAEEVDLLDLIKQAENKIFLQEKRQEQNQLREFNFEHELKNIKMLAGWAKMQEPTLQAEQTPPAAVALFEDVKKTIAAMNQIVADMNGLYKEREVIQDKWDVVQADRTDKMMQYILANQTAFKDLNGEPMTLNENKIKLIEAAMTAPALDTLFDMVPRINQLIAEDNAKGKENSVSNTVVKQTGVNSQILFSAIGEDGEPLTGLALLKSVKMNNLAFKTMQLATVASTDTLSAALVERMGSNGAALEVKAENFLELDVKAKSDIAKLMKMTPAVSRDAVAMANAIPKIPTPAPAAAEKRAEEEPTLTRPGNRR